MGRLILVGPMGSGKSSVAGLLAARLDWRLLDLDRELEQRAGRSVAELFEQQGEEAFRVLESAVLLRLLATPGHWVLACGGGTVLREENRQALRSAARVVWLDAADEELARRVDADAGGRKRPLLARALQSGDDGRLAALASVLAGLRSVRQQAYAEVASYRLTTDGASVEEVADRLEALLTPPATPGGGHGGWLRTGPRTCELRVELGPGRSYPVVVAEEGFGGLGERLLAALPAGAAVSSALLVTDGTVGARYGQPLREELARVGMTTHTVELEPGEASKRLETVTRLWDELAAAGADRWTPVVALGGGVVSDVAGFAAATWLRGVPWAVLPTTLLAQVDAAVGGKTGIDHASGKNRIGAFHQPCLVWCPVTTLATLPRRELRAGLAEAVKAAIVGDPQLFRLFEDRGRAILDEGQQACWVRAELVRRALAVKAAVVAADEREERGVRRSLNLGHTVGHALELASRQGPAPLLHGEAVAIGLAVVTRLARDLGRLEAAAAARIIAVLDELGLPSSLAAWTSDEVATSLRRWLAADKKRQGEAIALQVPEAIGRVGEVWLRPEEIVARIWAMSGGRQ